jgi:hypothetical protein
MTASLPEEQPQSQKINQASKEKIREFCYELALALRRATGKVIENDLAFLDEEKSDPEGRSEATKLDKKSDDQER